MTVAESDERPDGKARGTLHAAEQAVRRYDEKKSPVPAEERREAERATEDAPRPAGSLLGEGEALARLQKALRAEGGDDPAAPREPHEHDRDEPG
jgi:hypothetical protein